MKRLNTYLVTKARRIRRDRTRTIRRSINAKAGWGLAALLACCFALTILVAGWQYAGLTEDLPSIEQIPAQLNAQSATFTQPTRLLDRTGSQVIKDLSLPGIQRKYMRISGLGATTSMDFTNAVIALTEPNFRASSGVDLTSLNPDEHGTIAQQLVFHMLLSYEPATIQRALRERILAAQVISTYGHDRVLEWYINSLDFGHLAYGVEAGAQLYFNKSSDQLSLPEAAMLAGVGVAPALNPWDSPAGARAVQVEGLKALALQKFITPDILKVALEVEVKTTTNKNKTVYGNETFTGLVISELESILGRERVERGGLTIQTTMDFTLQQNLVCVIQVQLQSLEGDQQTVLDSSRECQAAHLLPLLPPGDTTSAGAIAASAVVSDPTTGQILAITGEINSKSELSTVNSHPAGTVINPFVYLTGFSQGLSPASLVWDAPSSSGLNSTEMVNFDGVYHGPVRIRIALANDYLLPLAKVLQQTGWYSLKRQTSSLGLNIPEGSDVADILDAPVNILELASAYNTLAAEGIRYGQTASDQNLPTPYFVLKVWDENDNLIYDSGNPDRFAVISSQLAYLVNSSLSDDLARRQSLGSASILQIGQTTAAKIGQRTQLDSAWTTGYTTHRSVVVWMGRTPQADDGVKINPRWSAGIWRAVMETAVNGVGNPGFIQPAGVAKIIVCDPSGMLPTADCPITVEEVFVTGNEPTSTDTLFKKLSINAETGLLATVFTPPTLVTEQVFMDIPSEYQPWARQAGLAVSPTSYDSLQVASADPAVHFSSPAMFDYLRGRVDITGSASANNFQSYQVQIGQGLNPHNWQQIGGGSIKPVVEGKLAVWDTTGLNGLYVIRLQVIDQDNVVKSALLQVSVDNTPPEVAIQFPVDGSVIDRQTTRQLFIKADTGGATDIIRVDLLIDQKIVTSIQADPYFFNWDVLTGSHTIQMKAYDIAGNVAASQEIHIEVN